MSADLVNPEQVQETPTARLRESVDTELEPRAPGTIYKVSIGVQTDNNLARDNMFVTPHYRDEAGTQSPAQLATQLANNFTAWYGAPVRGQVKVYLEDFNPGIPHNPLAVADFGTVGIYATSTGPRELALCLSYYAGQNTKRYRGRLYIPHAWIRGSGGAGSPPPTLRPTAGMISTVVGFGTSVLVPPKLNGMKWCVASTVDKISRNVTDFWVDDEWDIIRSRGLRGTTRTSGTA